MRWKVFLLVSIVLLFLFSSFALGESTVVTTPISNEITTSEQGTYSLKVTNNEAYTQRYSIYSLQSGQGWNVDPSPLKDKIIELASGQSHTTTIVATPLEDFVPGIYNVHITIQSDHGESYTKPLKFYVAPEGSVDYLPAIKATIDMNDKINPSEPVSIKLFLENRNPLDLTGLKIRIQSTIPEFVKEVAVDLPPLEKKTVEFAIVPSRIQQPKDYTLFFVFERNDETVKIIEKNVEVLTLLPEFEVEVKEEKKLLKTSRTLTVINGGNVRNTQVVKYPSSFLASLFTSSEGRSLKEYEKRFLTWEVELGPAESLEIYSVTNYRLLLYSLLAILLFMGFYFYVQPPLSINKAAATTKIEDSGALSEIKITLELKNHSNKPVKDVQVIDLVPGIANVDKGLELGTLKPKEIRHTKTGTKVIWSLAELDAHEHRLITYKMKAKLNILGTFSLPRAMVEFKRKRRKKAGKAYSNIFRISS